MPATVTRITAKGRATLVGLVAVVALSLCAAAPAASSAATGQVTTGYATATLSWNVQAKKVSGTVYDLVADGYCARVYTQGRNLALGWASPKYLGQACGKGTYTHFSDSAAVYGDQVNLKLCRGFISCDAWKLWASF